MIPKWIAKVTYGKFLRLTDIGHQPPPEIKRGMVRLPKPVAELDDDPASCRGLPWTWLQIRGYIKRSLVERSMQKLPG